MMQVSKLCQNKLQECGALIFGAYKATVEMCGHIALWRKPNTSYQHKHAMQTVKHDGEEEI